MAQAVLAIAGPHLSRRADLLALAVTALAALAVVVVPTLYLAALPAACGAAALAAPSGRRAASALAVWVPVSLAVVVGGLAIA
jgi:hypothetical protein